MQIRKIIRAGLCLAVAFAVYAPMPAKTKAQSPQPIYLPVVTRSHYTQILFSKEVEVPSFVGVGSVVTFTMKMVKDFDGLNTGYFITDVVPSGMTFVKFLTPTHKMVQVIGGRGNIEWTPFPLSPFINPGHVELMVGFVVRIVNPECGNNTAFLILKNQAVIPSNSVSVSCVVPTIAPPPGGTIVPVTPNGSIPAITPTGVIPAVTPAP